MEEMPAESKCESEYTTTTLPMQQENNDLLIKNWKIVHINSQIVKMLAI